MSANNDTTMNRFLFAILKQLDLRHIDWNKVASDEVLSQPITNGHAARMRYSRFRSSLQPHEPTRRNRTATPKHRVTKTRKEKDDFKEKKMKMEDRVKPEAVNGSPPAQQTLAQIPTKAKPENAPYGFDSRLTPGMTPGINTHFTPAGTPGFAGPSMIGSRMLTPCSDTDAFGQGSTWNSNPNSPMINSQNSYDFFGQPCPGHDEASWQPGLSAPVNTMPPMFPYEYSAFPAYENQAAMPDPGTFLPLNQSIEFDEDTDVKNEQWDGHA